MVLIGEGDIMLASALFFIGNIGVSGSTVFYDSLLPHVAKPRETDRVSSAGYVMGYISGGVLLLINLAWILSPGDVWLRGRRQRDARVVRRRGDLVGGLLDPAVPEGAGTAGGRRQRRAAFPIGIAFSGWRRTFREVRRYQATRSCSSSRCCSTRTASRR